MFHYSVAGMAFLNAPFAQLAFLDMAFTLALVAGTLLLLGGLVSFGVWIYRTTVGEGMRDPEEVLPDNDDELREGDSEDEWDYY